MALVLNLGKAKQSESEWVYLETSQGVVAVKIKRHNSDLRMVIHAPKEINIAKGNKYAKTANNSTATDNSN